MIANLDTENLPGSHWVGIFAKDNKIEVFDSLGMASTTTITSLGCSQFYKLDIQEFGCTTSIISDLWLLCINIYYC